MAADSEPSTQTRDIAEADGSGELSVRAARSRERSSADRAPGDTGCGAWRALCICEISNFFALRRQIGRAAADRLGHDVARIIEQICLDARVEPIGRALIEVSFERESPSAAAADVSAMQQVFDAPVVIDGELHSLRMTFGVAAAPKAQEDDVRIVEAAESALDQARSDGRTIMLDLSRNDLAFDRLTLMRELPRAIAQGEMFAQYQPKVHVRRQAIASAEALVRWRHPTRGLILPGDFIVAAEESGDIGPLTLWLLRQVIDDQKKLFACGQDLAIFVNISGVSLADADFVEEACRIIIDSKARIGFEITETSVIRDPEVAIRHLHRFAEIGVTLAIDDYGAGLSSLAYLKQLPASELKIDKMFVTQLTSSNRDPLIVRSTIDLAHALEMEVTAEGVETPAALALLSVMGCDMVQGYLISRPLDFDAFQNFLEEGGQFAAVPASPLSFARPEAFWKRA